MNLSTTNDQGKLPAAVRHSENFATKCQIWEGRAQMLAPVRSLYSSKVEKSGSRAGGCLAQSLSTEVLIKQTLDSRRSENKETDIRAKLRIAKKKCMALGIIPLSCSPRQ